MSIHDSLFTVHDFMAQAIKLARRAAKHDDVPIGAVIVRGGAIIARGENQVQMRKNPTLHAEIVAINHVCRKIGAKFLDDCEIYVTLEPCPMCATAISLARLRAVHFAAADPKGGGIVNGARVYDTAKNLWKPAVRQICEFESESVEMLKEFFKKRRKIERT
ncbi:hypothetical protein FACS189421_02620 [Bacteroidia bacterium]|nr:hypothetical protein FACS189421_02620 [Bacteroidia bacterium]